MLLKPVEVELLRVGSCHHPEWIALRGGRLRGVEFPAICALIRHPSAGPILYDTGYADRFEAATDPFPERLYRWVTPVQLPPEDRLETQLRARGILPSEVALAVISHLHADHVAGLRDLPAARFLALRAELAGSRDTGRWRSVQRGFLPALLPPDFGDRVSAADDRPAVELGSDWAPFDRGHDLLGDRSLIGVPLPGHTAGQLGLLVRDARRGHLLLAADACWSTRAWREGRPPAAVARVLMADWMRYHATLAGLRRLAAHRPDLLIVPSHCAEAFDAWQAHAGGVPGGEGRADVGT